MGRLNSGDQAEADRLETLYIPVLAVAALATLLLDAVLVLGQGSLTFLADWLLALGVAVLGATAAIRNFSAPVRLAIGGSLIAGLPVLILLAFLATGNTELFGQGAVLFGLVTVTWTLSVPLVEQCSGRTEFSSTANKTVVLTLIPPFLKLVDVNKLRKNMAFSGEALSALVVCGTLVFAFGDYLGADDPSATIPSALPFAVAFYALVATLWSLTKLAQRIAETPGSVQITGGFLRAWLFALLAVMGICGFAATLLPKSPIIATGQTVNRVLFGDPANRPHKPPSTSPTQNPNPGQQPGQGKASDARARIPGQAPLPGMNRHGLVAARRNPLVDGTVGAADSSLGLMEKVATAFEGKDTPKTGGQGKQSGQHGPNAPHHFAPSKQRSNLHPPTHHPSASPPSAPAPNAQTPSQPPTPAAQRPGPAPHPSTHQPASHPSTSAPQVPTPSQSPIPASQPPTSASPPPVPSPTSQPPPQAAQPPDAATSPAVQRVQEHAQRLQGLLSEQPIRVLKLLLALALAVAALWGLAVVIRRYLWPILSSVARWCWVLLSRIMHRRLGRYRARRAEASREREITRLAQTMPDPFADPFAGQAPQSAGVLACAAYDTFLAYLWLLGTERKPAETAFDLATRLCDTSQINARAVWCITRGSAAALFSAADLAEGDIIAMREALREIIGYVLKRVPADAVPVKQQAYRRLRAEEAYAAAALQRLEPALSANIAPSAA